MSRIESFIRTVLRVPRARSLAQRLRITLPSLGGAYTLRVYLGQQQLSSVMLRGGRELPDSAQNTELDNPSGHWQAAIDALRSLILQARVAAAPAAIHLEISLPSRWCQMLLAPWSDALLSPPDAARFLQTQLAALYGDQARSWQIVADDAPYGSPRTVCGTDTLLIEALKALAADQDCRCQIIEPALATALRTFSRQPNRRAASRQVASVTDPARTAGVPGAALQASAKAGSRRPLAHALAVVEAGRITMATIHSGRISAIQSQPCGLTWQLELPQAWQRWTLRAPELAAIESVAVIDLCPQSPAALTLVPPALPPRFHLQANPFGTQQAPSKTATREAA